MKYLLTSLISIVIACSFLSKKNNLERKLGYLNYI